MDLILSIETHFHILSYLHYRNISCDLAIRSQFMPLKYFVSSCDSHCCWYLHYWNTFLSFCYSHHSNYCCYLPNKNIFSVILANPTFTVVYTTEKSSVSFFLFLLLLLFTLMNNLFLSFFRFQLLLLFTLPKTFSFILPIPHIVI